MSKKIVIANLKMNLSANSELDHWITNFNKAKSKLKASQTEVVFCPQAVLLGKFIEKVKAKNISHGTQDCFWDQKGAFTGALSPTAIKSVGGKYVILGHSEKKKYFGENSGIVSLKIIAALRAGIQPILCIGESAQERRMGKGLAVIRQQLEKSLAEVSQGQIEKIVICYEPVWAISANNPDHLPQANDIMEARLIIKKLLTTKYSRSSAERVRIVYGGSVNPDNAQEACVEADMDGALVGKASLSPYDFVKIIQIINES